MFALSEGYLKEAVKLAVWSPLRRLGRLVLPWRTALLAVGAIGMMVAVVLAPRTSHPWDLLLGWGFIAQALLCSGSGLALWRKPLHAMAWVSASSVAVAAAVFVISPADNTFAGVVYAGAVAMLCALGVAGTAMVVPGGATIPRFAGFSEVHPLATALTLVSALGIAGFPLLPTFLGEDLLLHDTLRASAAASALITGVLALNGYLAVRNFAFTFLGQYRLEEPSSWGVVSGALVEAPLEERVGSRVA